MLALTACIKFRDEAPDAKVIPTNPNIEIISIGDNDFTFTVTPAEGTGFFSYAVMAGEPKELVPATLFQLGYSDALKKGTVDYSKTKTPLKVTMEELDFNTKYSVYAVAATEQGLLSDVVTNWAVTTDTVKPSMSGYTRKENVLTLNFSEEVVYNSEIRATATYYAVNLAVIDAEGKLVKTGEQGKGVVEVACSGKSATLTVTLDGTNPLPDGAYFTVGYGSGMFKDVTGNNIEGMEEKVGVTSQGKLGFGNLYGRVANKAFEIVPETDLVTPADTDIAVPMPEDVEFYTFAEDAAATLTKEIEGGNKTITIVYDLAFGYYEDNANIVFYYPLDVDLNPGDTFTLDLAEGSVVDIYGNVNEAMSQEYLYSYGYTPEDLYGTYTLNATTQYAGKYSFNNVIIAPAPKTEEWEGYTVAMYNLFSETPCCDDLDAFVNYDTPFAANFDGETGQIEVAIDAIGAGALENYGWSNYVLAITVVDDEMAPFSFSMPEKGTIVANDIVYVYLYGLGTWDLYQSITLVKTSDEYTVPNAGEASAKKSSLPKSTTFVQQIAR